MTNGTTTNTIADFLVARIDDDETAARAVAADSWTVYPDGVMMGDEPYYAEICRGIQSWDAPHLNRWDPARVLADCAARRAIVAALKADLSYEADLRGSDILRHLAAPYAGHPDYDPAWAV